MKVTSRSWIIVTLFALILCQCACNPLPYRGRYMDIYTAAAFSVVGAESLKDIDIIDQDQYGRKLAYLEIGNPVFYTFYSNRTKENMNAHVFLIVQKTKEDKVYYYEDVCFRVYENKHEFTGLERKALEVQNDWGLSLSEQKMTYRNVIRKGRKKLTATELYNNPDTPALNDPLSTFYLSYYNREILNPEDEIHVFSDLLDVDKSLDVLWVIYRYDVADDGSIDIKGYFMLTKPEGTGTKSGIVKEIENINGYWKELSAFKQENGWQSY